MSPPFKRLTTPFLSVSLQCFISIPLLTAGGVSPEAVFLSLSHWLQFMLPAADRAKVIGQPGQMEQQIRTNPRAFPSLTYWDFPPTFHSWSGGRSGIGTGRAGLSARVAVRGFWLVGSLRSRLARFGGLARRRNPAWIVGWLREKLPSVVTVRSKALRGGLVAHPRSARRKSARLCWFQRRKGWRFSSWIQ